MELVFIFFMLLLLLPVMSEVPEFNLKLRDANGVSLDEEDAMDFEEGMAAEFGEEDLAQYITNIKQMPGLFIPVAVPNNQCEDEHVVEVGKENIPENQGVVYENQVKDKPADGSVPFLELDGDLMKEIYFGGQNKSARKVEWARKRFDEWRKHTGLPLDKKIEDMDLREFARLLEMFILQVCKLNGALYPTERSGITRSIALVPK